MHTLRRPAPAFTFVELIVVIAIIGVLATLSIVYFNNSRQASRDAKRVADIQDIQLALKMYYQDHGEYPETITPGAPIASGSTNYLLRVPTNPSPRTDNGCPDEDYAYEVLEEGQRYSLTFCVAQPAADLKYAGEKLATSNGILDCGPGSYPVVGSTLLNTNDACVQEFECGNDLIDIDGYSYDTVYIGGQCWMAENLRTKRKPNGTLMTNLSNGSERDCIGSGDVRGTESDCIAGYALYTWAAAMNGSTDPGARGICPAGWHIPTDGEWSYLESFLTNPSEECGKSRWGSECLPAGQRLKVGGSSGFNALLTGIRGTSNSFELRGLQEFLSSSSQEEPQNTWILRRLFDDSAEVSRETLEGFYEGGAATPVRCLQD